MRSRSAADHLAVKKLLRALKRLQPAQGDRARRNARTAVHACLKRLRAVLDLDYPLLNVKRVPKRAPLQIGSWEHRSAGYARAAGYRPKAANADALRTQVYVPGWCFELAKITLGSGSNLDGTVTRVVLRSARMNQKARAALLAAARLAAAS